MPTAFPTQALADAGLNRQFVFDLAALPDELLAPLGDTQGFRQLILLGHGGRRLWACVQAAQIASAHPIDDYCIATVDRLFRPILPSGGYRLVYPGDTPIGLQSLGKLAGWHHPTPFMVGIDEEFGSWSAYRAVLLADSDFCPSVPVDRKSPCASCRDTPCIVACPAGALAGGRFDLTACSDFRLQPDSPCALGCLARQACPVGAEHRYESSQITHSYARSLAMIAGWRAAWGRKTGKQP